MRLVVWVAPDLCQAVKDEAHRRKATLGQIVSEALNSRMVFLAPKEPVAKP